MDDSFHRRLIELVDPLVVQRGDFMLASGKKSSYCVDMRRAALRHGANPLVGHVILGMLKEVGFDTGMADAVDGLTMGADPVATAIMHATASRGLDVDAFVVRKEAKDHDTKRGIEGPSIEGRNTVVLEDTLTTDGSPIRALEAAREAGTNALAMAVVVDWATGTKEKIGACGVPYLAALGLEDLGLGVQAWLGLEARV